MATRILENAGICDIILTAYSDFEAGGIGYLKGDIVVPLRNVPAVFSYIEDERTARQGQKTTLSTNEKVLDEVVVGEIPLTDRFLRLFSSDISIGIKEPVLVDVPVQGGVAFLPTDLLGWPVLDTDNTNIFGTDGSVLLDTSPLSTIANFRVIGMEGANIIHTYDAALNSISFQTPIEDGVHTLFYFVYRDGCTYNINSGLAHVPYLSMHLVTRGNIDKKKALTTIYVPRVSIIDAPVLSLQDSTVTHYNLRLKVIDDNTYIGF